MSNDYRWSLHQGQVEYAWAVFDQAGERVASGSAPSRAAAVLAAERAIWRLRCANPADATAPNEDAC
jgi:hypothetical protein